MALPGGYRGNDGDDGGDHGLAEAMLAMASGTREASKHVRYGARNNNGLRKLNLIPTREKVEVFSQYTSGRAYRQLAPHIIILSVLP